MKYIVFDLEWNQPYTKVPTPEGQPRLTGEIIQIGAVRLNKKMEIEDTFKVIVRPMRYTKMNEKVKEITGIDEDTLKNGKPFARAYAEFMSFCGKNFYWFTWGRDDFGILKQNLILHGMDADKLKRVYNLQPIFSKQILKSSKPVALSKAVEALGETLDGAHDALNDAMGAALVCRRLDIEAGIAEIEKGARRAKKTRIRRRRPRRPRNTSGTADKKENTVCTSKV